MNEAIASQVIGIVARQSRRARPDITPEHMLRDLQIDSLGTIETVFELEEAFGVELAHAHGGTSTETLQNLIDAVEAAIDESRSTPVDSARLPPLGDGGKRLDLTAQAHAPR